MRPKGTSDLVGTQWRNRDGHVATVERINPNTSLRLVHGRWDTGLTWTEFIDDLAWRYVEVDGGPGMVRP